MEDMDLLSLLLLFCAVLLVWPTVVVLFQKAAINKIVLSKVHPCGFIHQLFCEINKCIIIVKTVIIPQTIIVPTNSIIVASLMATK